MISLNPPWCIKKNLSFTNKKAQDAYLASNPDDKGVANEGWGFMGGGYPQRMQSLSRILMIENNLDLYEKLPQFQVPPRVGDAMLGAISGFWENAAKLYDRTRLLNRPSFAVPGGTLTHIEYNKTTSRHPHETGIDVSFPEGTTHLQMRAWCESQMNSNKRVIFDRPQQNTQDFWRCVHEFHAVRHFYQAQLLKKNL